MITKLSPCRLMLASGLLAAVLVFSGQLHAQQEPMTVSLLRRMAEVADGRRNEGPVFVVLAHAFPHHAAGVFLTREEADSALLDSGPDGWGVYGPIDSSHELPLPPSRIARCIHLQSAMNPGGGAYCPGSFFLLSEVDSVTIGVHGPWGSDISRFDPRLADAVFFTLSAIQKFAIPYYSGILGADYTAGMNAEITRLFREGR